MPRRSEKLSVDEVITFTRYMTTFPTKTDAAIALGISRPTLDLVLIRYSGHPDTIRKIRRRLTIFNKKNTQTNVKSLQTP